MYHIFHSTSTHFSFADRLRILFGQRVNMEVKIQTTDENVVVVSTKTDVWVNKIFRKTPKSGYLDTPCQGNCGMNYCDENGCMERKRVLTNPIPPDFSGSYNVIP